MQKTKFDGIAVTLASVEDISKRSHGAVDNPDTVNYRTGRPKQHGLFCESIFGPVKNYECSCGKYKGVRYKGIVCERCGVEVTSSRVRRSRMGHVELASPVVHAWYKSSPSGGIHQLLQLSSNEIDRILTFVKYSVAKDVSEDQKKLLVKKLEENLENKTKELDELFKQESKESKDNAKKMKEIESLYQENKESIAKEFNRLKSIISDLGFASTILESDYRNIFWQYSDIVKFVSGPEGILEMLQNIDVKKEIKKRLEEYSKLKSEDQKKKLMSLIKLLINLYVSGVKPENMVLRKLPVIPPDLRPVVQLDGGKFASSDVNLYYRRVLMRNIRLRKMIQVGMPDVVKKNEIRLLQESVNNLLVGEKGGSGPGGAGIKVFKSLSDMLSGKEGIFRKNLLGKRVDYSGRSIITVGPDLRLDECGLPIYIAVKMFTPFIIGKLIDKKIVYTPKQAEKLIKDGSPIALKFLEEVIKDKYVLLNRAPTLHRLSIEAFKIKLMSGKTIRIHPLVCPAFNADFDGDQMAVHLPLSDEAQKEAKEIIAADKNILRPGSGEPTITHSQDMVLGIYYLTDFFDPKYPDYNTEQEWQEKTPIVGFFESMEQVIKTFENGEIVEKDKIVLKFKNKHITTTVGRVIFNSVLPEKVQFVNFKQSKKELKNLLSAIFDNYDMSTTVNVADDIKDLGFSYATIAANSINILDMKVPAEKEETLKVGEKKANEIYKYFYKGFFSEDEKHRLIVEVWSETKSNVEQYLKNIIGPGNNLYSMVDSGARGSQTHMTQISGMKGLVVNPKGEIIELPIKGSFVEGLKPTEYFISAHSGRKGKADTALRTAESGYLTRKLCDSSQEVIVRTEDCGTEKSIYLTKEESELKGEDFFDVIYGRVLAKDVEDEKGNIILKKGEMLDKDNISLLENDNIKGIHFRSPLICNSPSGVCQKCYGMDLATRKTVEIGVPVGIVAAQSIGEPATQLTMQTFHHGGVAGGADMSQGIDRIKQLFEVRAPKKPAVVAPFDGVVRFTEKGADKHINIESEYQKKPYILKEGYEFTVKKGDSIKKGGDYASKGRSKLKVQEEGVVIEKKKDSIVFGIKEVSKKSYKGLSIRGIKEGDHVYKGQILTNGAIDISEYKDIVGDLQAQKYIISEAKRVYSAQGQGLNDRHIEVVVKQLFSKVFIEKPGDTSFIPGTYIKYEDFVKINEELVEQGKKPAQGRRLALGLTNIAKETDSWLSAASFQETIRVMVGASLKGAIDELSDLKSNVIIGRLLPVGEVYRKTNGYE
ncbi:MAG TPA: DNA-directed RNA polymerase subunit beta' [Candidatus Absconditabacterales bacterium]|nr:DNA-directed RNA polymerase subunit beta' [Candidatus Absconditabacterales bacterium]